MNKLIGTTYALTTFTYNNTFSCNFSIYNIFSLKLSRNNFSIQNV